MKKSEPVFHKTAVNAMCDPIALLPYGEAADHPDLLTLHAAAVVIDGQAVLLPAVRRGGKSVMTAALAARGAAVYSDDVVGVTARARAPLRALAAGIAPRLRLPLPDGISPEFAAFGAAHKAPENGQY